MRSRHLNFKILDYRSQTRIIPSKYGSPIPVWGQNDGHSNTFSADTFPTAKLRRFCLEYPAVLSASPALRPYPGWFRNPLRAIAVIGIGASLGLSTPAFPDWVRTHSMSLTSSSGSDTGAIQPASLWLNSLGLTGKKAFSAQVAFAGISQSGSSWVYPPYSNSPQFLLPVEGYPITSGFGNRVHPIFGDLRFHNGIDIGTPIGIPVRASSSGYVSFADWDGGYGKTVIIQHTGGYETLYAHLDHVQVKVGDRVRSSQIIGLSGSTGYVTGPHLHFEIRRNEIAYNPLDYF